MGTLLLVVGVAWAIIGVVKILGMPWAGMEPGSSLGAIGLIFDMLLFILPGLVVTGIGLAINKRGRNRAGNATTESTAEPASKKCPYCTETVKSDAIVCRHCGRDLPVPNSDKAYRERQFEEWLEDQRPPLSKLTLAERAAYRQAFDYQFPPRRD